MGRDKIGPLFLIVLSITVCVYSMKLKIGSLNNPGSGFLPFIAGLLFGLLSLLQIVKSYSLKRLTEGGKYPKIGEGEKQPENIKKMIFVFLSLVVYVIVISKLGYLISTFLLIVFLFRIGKSMKWWFILAFSFFITFGSYFIFDRWLSCRFPVGILGYWR